MTIEILKTLKKNNVKMQLESLSYDIMVALNARLRGGSGWRIDDEYEVRIKIYKKLGV